MKKIKNLELFEIFVRAALLSGAKTKDIVETIENLREMFGFSDVESDNVVNRILDEQEAR